MGHYEYDLLIINCRVLGQTMGRWKYRVGAQVMEKDSKKKPDKLGVRFVASSLASSAPTSLLPSTECYICTFNSQSNNLVLGTKVLPKVPIYQVSTS
jgi:hypothetical protein